MEPIKIYFAGDSPALEYAKAYAAGLGYRCAETADAAQAILLPVPTPSADPLELTNPQAVIYGGNLPQLYGMRQRDLLQDEEYLAKNAAITAHCALTLALQNLRCTLPEAPILILGWGRIGQCLARLCGALGADVTVYARKDSALGMIQALGYKAADSTRLQGNLGHFRVIFNTVPAPILSVQRCRDDCVKIDLASQKGLAGEGVLWARGLPGKMAPESSGRLMIESLLRLQEQEA